MLVLHGIFVLGVVFLLVTKRLPGKDGILLFILSAIGILQLFMQSPTQALLRRPDYGEEQAEYTLYYQAEGDEEIGTVAITVEPRQYGKEQLDQMAADAFAELQTLLPGENKSVDAVSEPLVLPQQLEGFPFSISWQIWNSDLISVDGTIMNESIREAVCCQLTAELAYEGYSAAMDYYVSVVPKTYTRKEEQERQLKAAIDTLLEQDPKQSEIEVPRVLDGFFVYGSIPQTQTTMLWSFLGVMWLIYRRAREKNRQKEQDQKHKLALQYMYPVLVNELVLYLSAGMTVKTAFKRVFDSMEHGEKERQVLAEEIGSMFHELEGGVSEKDAYRHFGRRCGQADYGKLMSLMIQTIVVGGKGLMNRLEELETDAFLKRKEYARRRGEEASTKLLGPMILLLAVVMILLIVPGFYGMQM